MERTRILVAESDAKASMALAKHLRQQGYDVAAANEAIGVMRAAREMRPDVVIMNSQLAGGGGVVALRRIRSNVFTTNIPVIVVLGKSGPREKEMLAAGAQECLANPVDPKALGAAVDRHRLESLDFTEAPKAVLQDRPRLQDLEATSLLDTAPEESFDRVTRLATRLLAAPTALMSLVDRDRQFFKSQVGLGHPYAKERQTRLSHSFCQWVVSGKEQLVVPDANQHPVLKSNLAIRDMGVVAYAGVPISGRTGEAIGSFCAIDSKARAWSEAELETLRDLAAVAEAHAVLAHAKRATGAARNAQRDVATRVAGNAIRGAVNILRRHGARLADADRADLFDIIDEQARYLTGSEGAAPR